MNKSRAGGFTAQALKVYSQGCECEHGSEISQDHAILLTLQCLRSC